MGGDAMSKPKGDVLELKKILRDKLESEDWDNVRNFKKQTNIPISSETVRRALHDEYTSLEPMSLALICRYLRFTNSQIRDILKRCGSCGEVVGNGSLQKGNVQVLR